jgi:AcrR family transcriptional regulator
MTEAGRDSRAHDQRRERMLQAAVEVICERGFSDTRISDVAKLTKASPAVVIYYFGTKDGLLTEAMRYSEDLFYTAAEELLATLDTAREKLEALVRVTCFQMLAGEIPGAWGLWFDLWVQAFRHPEVAKDRAEFDRRWSATIAGVVVGGQASGELAEVDIEEFVIAFAALLDGLSIQVALRDELITSDRAFGIAMRFAARYFGFEWSAPVAVAEPAVPTAKALTAPKRSSKKPVGR